jgi:uncharacterized membrane protein
MMWSLVAQTLSFRIAVVIIDYVIMAAVLQRPLEAGVITIIRHVLHTFMYWGHEVAWSHRRLNTAAFLPGSWRYTLGKTISFRALSVIADFALFMLLTGNVGISSVGTLLIGVSNTIFFYFHERWWQRWRAEH